MTNNIHTQDVHKAQKLWGDGLVKIGGLFLNKDNNQDNNQDYKQEANNLVQDLYAYNSGQRKVLFKPTKAKHAPFRGDFYAALSYFIGDNTQYPEDKGFAIEPWKEVSFNNHDIYIHNDIAFAMGEYTFTKYNDEKVKVEYTFGYIKDVNNNLKIILHHSSLPFSG